MIPKLLHGIVDRLRPLGQGSLCSFFIATAADTAAATVFAILRVLDLLWTFKVPSKRLQLSRNLYQLILLHISIEQTKLIDLTT